MKAIIKYLALLLVVVLGFASIVPSFAQGEKDMLFVPGNILDKLSSAQATNSYYLEVTEPQVMSLQILTLTEAYSPSFAVYNSAGEAIPVIADVMAGWGVDMKVTLPEAGVYRILVGALDAGYGDYLLRTTKIGSYENHQYKLALDSSIEANISGNQVIHRYSFTAQPNQALTLYVRSDMNIPDISLSLTNQSKSQEAGAMDTPVSASSFCIPAGTDNYNLDLMSANPSVDSPYGLLLVSNPTENCAETLGFAELEAAAGIYHQNTVANTVGDETATTNQDGDIESAAQNDNCDTATVAVGVTDVNAHVCADVNADLDDTEVGAGADVCAGLEANVGVNGVNADVCADVNADLGDIEVDADADVNANLGDTGVDAGVDVNVNPAPTALPQVNVDANVNVNPAPSGAPQVNVDANVNVNPAPSGLPQVNVNADLNANLPSLPGLP